MKPDAEHSLARWRPTPEARWGLRFDAARRLGPRPVLLALAGRGPWARWRQRRHLPGWQAVNPLSGPDIRPAWEAARWAGLWDADIAATTDGWLAANPPYRGPHWLCGQEAAIRALHLLLACALQNQRPDRATLALLAQRIAANPAYAMAQDNNHPVTEAASLWACGLALGDAAMAGQGRRRLDATLLHLITPEGSFAQPSPAYHRMLLDSVAVAAWLGLRAGAPALPEAAMARMAAATCWLHRLACPQTGRLPRLGHQDGSHLADLSGAGPDDARPSLERAARLFCAASAGWPADPGCLRMGLVCPAATLPSAPPAWVGVGLMGGHAHGMRWVMRTGPLRFRPNHADLLHLDLWDGPLNLLRDGGTGAYNPREAWWLTHLQGTAAHNTIGFDGEDQMPRLGPFLFARWPETGALPQGAWLRDHRGRRHAREVEAIAGGLRITDRIAGPFGQARLRWRLPPGPWQALCDGAALGRHRLRIAGAACRLVSGWESLAYGEVTACPVLEAALDRPGRLVTEVLTQ